MHASERLSFRNALIKLENVEPSFLTNAIVAQAANCWSKKIPGYPTQPGFFRYAATTGTMGSGRNHGLFSSRLEKLVFGGGAPSRRRLVAVGGPAKDPLAALLAKQAPGSATAAITEQLLCASAATVVMCNRRGACACGRGLDSGFVSAIKFYRARMGLSVRGDAAGGIFSF